MSSRIANVSLGKASINAVLSTTRVYSCLAVMMILNDDRTFMFHVDPSIFDLEDKFDMEQEVQKLIKKSISMFNQNKNKANSSFKSIFIIGGLSNDQYRLFNKQINQMRDNYTTIKPTIDGLSIDQLREFLERVEYCNTTINQDGGDVDQMAGLVPISDLTIVSDRTVTPPLLFMAQYHDLEGNLYGGTRTAQPQILLIYNFDSKCWSIIDMTLSTLQSKHVRVILDEFRQNLLSGDDSEKEKLRLMNYIANIKH